METNMLQIYEQVELLKAPANLDEEFIEDLIMNAETYIEDLVIQYIFGRDPDHYWHIISEITFYDQLEQDWIEEADVVEAHMSWLKSTWWDQYVCTVLYPHAKQLDHEGNLIALFGVTQ